MTSTTPAVKYTRINATQVTLSIEGYEKTLLLTYKAGWNGGGNNYRSSIWMVGQVNQFALKSFPAKSNNLRALSPALIEFVRDYIQS